jgi:hypothetical protein
MGTGVGLRKPIVVVLAFALAVTAGACFRDPAAPNPPDDEPEQPDPGSPTMVALDGNVGAPFFLA